MNQIHNDVAQVHDFYFLQDLYQVCELYKRSRRNLLLVFYEYRCRKQYKADGFSSFEAAFRFLKTVAKVDLEISSLRKYFSVFDSFARYGYEIQEVCRYPVSRLAALQPYLAQLPAGQLPVLMEKGKAAFVEALTQIGEGRK